MARVRSNGHEGQTHFCSQCIFLANFDLTSFPLAIQNMVEKGRLGLRKIKFCGLFTMPGWSGHLEFFAFQCPSCNKIALDYPHGYEDQLNCSHCCTP